MPHVYARMIVVALAAQTLLAAASPQVEPGAAGTVRGRVVAADGGTPLARAHVFLSGTALREGMHALTDGEGLYELADVPPGTYQVRASKPGYAPLVHGQRRPADATRPVVVRAAATVDEIDFALPRAGVIVVRVVDESGEPIAGVRAMPEQRRFQDGERRLVSTGVSLLAETDDRGEVRLPDLVPGEYYVRAGSLSLAARDPRSYGQRYFPGVSSPDEAQPVSLGAGEEAQVTIQLAAERFATVGGIVLGADGAPLRAGRIRLSGGGFNVFTGPGTGGSFSFTRVPPGDYVLEVGPNPTGEPASTDVASIPVSVAGDDVSDLVVAARGGGRLEGRLVFETPLPPDIRPGAFQFRADRGSSDMILPRFTIRDDSTFEAAGFLGPRVVRLRAAPAGWFLKSVFVSGRNVIDTPVDFGTGGDISGVEIVLTQMQSIVTGAAIDADGSPVAESVVVVFPEDREEWTASSRFFGTAVPDGDGAFRVGGLPAGRYLAIALNHLQSGEERDPELLDRISTRAERLSLAEGETRTLNLRVVER